MATKRPLNPDAVAAADSALAAKTGGRKLTTKPEDAALRRAWMEEYEKVESGGADNSQPDTLKAGIQYCPHANYTFVGSYRYEDGTPVPGACYVLKDMGDEVLDRGKFDAQGRFRKTGLKTPYAHFEVNKDPTPTQYSIKPDKIPEPAAHSAAFLDDAWDLTAGGWNWTADKAKGAWDWTAGAAKAAGEWTWGTVQGDFNENQSFSQIIVNMVVGFVPIADQVLDVRDLIANLLHLADYYYTKDSRTPEQIAKDNEEFFGQGREFALWFNIVITGIGCVPEIGSAAKGVIKAIIKKSKDLMGVLNPHSLKQIFDSVAEVLNKYGKFNAKDWLKNDFRPRLGEMVEFAKSKIEKAIQGLEEAIATWEPRLRSLPSSVPGYGQAQSFLAQIQRWKAAIPKLKASMAEMIGKVRKKIEELTDKLLKNDVHSSKGGVADGQEKILKQGKAEPPELPDIHVRPPSFDDVAKKLKKDGKLPDNFITKEEAKKLGWDPKKGNLGEVAPGKSIGGDVFKNKGQPPPLPEAPGRTWKEADINYSGGHRGAERIVYSSDGLIYKTTDHYKTFTEIK